MSGLLYDFIMSSFCSSDSNGGSHTETTATIDPAVVDELWETVSQTYPILIDDWLECFVRRPASKLKRYPVAILLDG